MLNIYLEEANELLSKLEACLLQLGNNASQKQQVEEIFRIMHTLKGNSSMFGLDKVARFIHNLESLYDNIRNGKQNVTESIINITFKSLDHIKAIIHDPELNNEAVARNDKEYTFVITSLLTGKAEQTSSHLQNQANYRAKTPFISCLTHIQMYFRTALTLCLLSASWQIWELRRCFQDLSLLRTTMWLQIAIAFGK